MLKTADTLQIDLIPFRDEIQGITRRGRMVIALMRKEGADQSRINSEESAIDREIMDARIRTTHAFGDVLTQIIRENR